MRFMYFSIALFSFFLGPSVRSEESDLPEERIVKQFIIADDFNHDSLEDIACISRNGPEDPLRVLIFLRNSSEKLRLAFDQPLLSCPSCGGTRGLGIGFVAKDGELKVTEDQGSSLMNYSKKTVLYSNGKFTIRAYSATFHTTDPAQRGKALNEKKDVTEVSEILSEDEIQNSNRLLQLVHEVQTLLAAKREREKPIKWKKYAMPLSGLNLVIPEKAIVNRAYYYYSRQIDLSFNDDQEYIIARTLNFGPPLASAFPEKPDVLPTPFPMSSRLVSRYVTLGGRTFLKTTTLTDREDYKEARTGYTTFEKGFQYGFVGIVRVKDTFAKTQSMLDANPHNDLVGKETELFDEILSRITFADMPSQQPLIWESTRKECGYEIKMPQGVIAEGSESCSMMWVLPHEKMGTNLGRKELIVAVDGPSPEAALVTTELTKPQGYVTINGWRFLKIISAEHATGTKRERVSYVAHTRNHTYTIMLQLWSTNSGHYERQPPLYYLEEETKLFDEILKTFKIDEVQPNK